MNNKITTRMAVLAVAALALSLIPLLAMSHYLHPMADDYVFAASTHQTWLRTHSLIAVIKAAFDVAAACTATGKAPTRPASQWPYNRAHSAIIGSLPFCLSVHT